MKKLLSLIVALAMIFSLAACGSSSSGSGDASDSAETNTVVINMGEGFSTLDPGRVYEKYALPIAFACYETLFYFASDDGDPEPLLAQSYEYSEDGLTLTIQLREDVTFASGNAMTSADVVFSIMRTKNLQDNPSFICSTIDSVEADGDYTVIIRLNQVDSGLLSKLTYNALSIVDSETVIANGGTDADDAATTDTAQSYLDSNSAGSGQFIITSFIVDEEVVLEKNPNYWGESTTNVDKYILKIQSDSNSQMMSLGAGDIDIALNLTDDTIEELADNDSVAIINQATKTAIFVMMNMDESIGGAVSDANVQQAIRLAIDYAGIQQIIGEGSVTPYSFIQVGFTGSLGERSTDYTDVEAAKALLAEAGYADGLEITLTVSDLDVNGTPLTDLAQKIASDLSEIGITVTIETLAWSGGYGDAYRNGELAFTVMYWGIDYNDPNNMIEFLPGATVGLRAGWSADMDSELAELYNAIMSATDAASRTALLEEAQEAMYEYGPFIFIAQPSTHAGYNTRLTGVTLSDSITIDLTTINVQ